MTGSEIRFVRSGTRMVPPEFSVLWVGTRYRRREVDAFVDRLLSSVDWHSGGSVLGRGRPLTRSEVLAARFTRVLAGRGYAADEVDEFLGQATDWLPVRRPGERRDGRAGPLPDALRSGYDDAGEADALLARLMAALENRPGGPPVRLRDIRRVRFTLNQVREGYDATDVRMFLQEAEAWLRSTDRRA
jgi:DivIVA domain-containing protein